MCGRYQFAFSDRNRFNSRYEIEGEYPYSEIRTRYNVAPGQDMPVVTSHNPNTVEIMKWGLIPEWEKSDKPKGFINLRDDTVIHKKWAWKYLRFQRCLVPASGFYEWRKTGEGKTPYYIRPETDGYFSFAGLYSEWHDPAGAVRKTYTIITTSPNAFMEPIHNRMPVILSREDEPLWLNPDTSEIEQLASLIRPYAGKMEAYPVSRKVNSPATDDASLIQAAGQQELL